MAAKAHLCPLRKGLERQLQLADVTVDAQAPGLARIEAEVQNDRLPRLGRDRGEVSLVMHIAVIAQPLRKAFRTV